MWPTMTNAMKLVTLVAPCMKVGHISKRFDNDC